MIPRDPASPGGRSAGATGWRRVALAFGLAALAAPLGAQSVLCLDRDGKLEVVQRAERNTALVLEDGRWTGYVDAHFVLQPTPEYLPVLVAVENPHFGKGARAVSDDGPLWDATLVQAGRFVFTADLESRCALDNVVLMLALFSEQDGNRIFLWGVGHLDAHEPKRVSIDIVTPFKLRGVRLRGYHIFVDGREALNSHIPAGRRAAALNRIVAGRVAKETDATAQPLMISDALYPEALKSGGKGHAVIRCRVDVKGAVADPVVKEATDPAFGAAALEAIKEWRFVPAVKGGVAVESMVEVPFDFAPPS